MNSTPTPNKPKPPADASHRRQSTPVKRPSRTGWWIAASLATVVVIAAIVATVAGGDAGSASTKGLEQTRAVEISGQNLAPFPESEPDAAIGQPVPTIVGHAFDGSQVTIDPNKPPLYVVLAHWCPHCQREVPRLVRWMAGGDVPVGLQVIGISTSTTSERPN